MSDRWGAFGGKCDAEGCDEPTPWDMVGVLLDETQGYCSPDCALVALEASKTVPDLVTIHDPQHAVSRDKMQGVTNDVIDFDRNVDSNADAEDAIRETGQLFEYPFRPSPDA